MSDPQDDEARRRLCQACFKLPAENHCQVCRRFVCDGCVAAPGGELETEDYASPIEHFLQAAQTRCNACRDEDARLPDPAVDWERPGPES